MSLHRVVVTLEVLMWFVFTFR